MFPKKQSLVTCLQNTLGFIMCPACILANESVCKSTADVVDLYANQQNKRGYWPRAMTRDMLAGVVSLTECYHQTDAQKTLLNTVMFLHEWLQTCLGSDVCLTEHAVAVDVHEVFCYLDTPLQTFKKEMQALTVRELLAHVQMTPNVLLFTYMGINSVSVTSRVSYLQANALFEKAGLARYEDHGLDLIRRIQQSGSSDGTKDIAATPTLLDFFLRHAAKGKKMDAKKWVEDARRGASTFMPPAKMLAPEKPLQLLLVHAAYSRELLKIEPVEEHKRFIKLYEGSTAAIPAAFHTYYEEARRARDGARVIKIVVPGFGYWQGSIMSFVNVYRLYAKYRLCFAGLSTHTKNKTHIQEDELKQKYTTLYTSWLNTLKPQGFKNWTRIKRIRWLRKRPCTHITC